MATPTRTTRRRLGPFTRTWLDRVPGIMAKLLQAAALLSFLGGLGLHHSRFYTVVSEPFTWLGIPTGASVFGAVLLLVWATAALRRKRIAWTLAIILEILNVIAGIGLIVSLFTAATTPSTMDNPTAWALITAPVATLVSLGILILMWRVRDAFPGRIIPGAWIEALTVLVIGLSMVTAFGLLLVTPFHHSLLTIKDRFHWVIVRTLGPETKIFLGDPTGTGPAWAGFLLSLLAAGVVILALVVFLRGATRAPHPGDDLKVRGLLLEAGDDSLGYFATRRDRLTVFSPDGRSAISFGVKAGVALAAGDPLGHRDSWDQAIAAWLDECRSYGWVPAVISTGEEGARAFKEAGLSVRRMGDEAIITAADFELRAHPQVSKAVRRVRASGATVQVRRLGDIIHGEREQLRECADLWRDGEERGFSMALDRIFDDVDAREVITTVHNAEGELEALLGFSPWGMRGASLDVMRRSPNATNGVNEAMVAALLTEGPSMGIDRISLNFAMFRTIFVDGLAVDASLQARALAWIMRKASHFWQLEQLYESNAKYGPSWKPRYLCFLDAAQFAQVVLAAGILEGFIPIPKWIRQRGTSAEPGIRSEEYVTIVAQQVADHVRALMPSRRLSDEDKRRRTALETLLDQGIDAYPVGVEPGVTPQVARDRIALWAQTDHDEPMMLRVEGRVRVIRDHGGLMFVDISGSHDRLQLVLAEDMPGSRMSEWRSSVGRGDIVVVDGLAMVTNTGELSVNVTSWRILSKALSAPPRARRNDEGQLTVEVPASASRTVQLLADPDALDLIRQRSHIVTTMRHTLSRLGYTEVETPILQSVHGGANARPFITHLNAYDADVFLRIAPELFLKRLAVAGMSHVFEIGRNFRNEGVDATHNPEFTSLEAYVAHGDYMTMRALTEVLIKDAAVAIHGEAIALRPAGTPGTEGAPFVLHRGGVDYVGVDIAGEWPVVSVHDAISRAVGRDISVDTPLDELRDLAAALDINLPPAAGVGECIDAFYDEFVESRTTLPTFYKDFPVETSPLTRHHRHDSRLAERWDLVAWGTELGTAYTELTDPGEQRDRFTAQSLRAAAGDPEAMSLDEDFLRSLELGLIPTGGLGIGVDRIAMLVTGAPTIRDVIAFPYSRPVR
ncbi:bifunctional lysylphosphatidylglycerol synthetase/lysine--tRNA ligase LysX [Actinomyces vulturis]|uniref:bifunctional lysylphosphatidylglycerol synthetase/lysine--tRNA ligase LysX n=1 Tax=Actinomyces vulturis TaxID=1857645 RepID=UPI0009F29B9F|nr:bifunctional lysylphosphatidylglycerol synthetase/lysine--tRNA ligase LysX [Actinomyces vulturis]